MSEQIRTKQCCICKQFKSPSEFHKARREKVGLQGQCKICQAKYQKEYIQTEKGKAAQKRHSKTEKRKITLKRHRQTEKYITAQKRYNQSEEGKVSRRAINKRYSLRHPERVGAHKAVKDAIRAGKLPRLDTLQCHYCYCPKQAKQYHHHKGYEPEHWLDVIPVCTECHIRVRVSNDAA